MFEFQTQLDELKSYLKSQGNFTVKIRDDHYMPKGQPFYEISHPNFVNIYVNKFRTYDDSSSYQIILQDFIDSTKEKVKLFDEYFKYFNSSNEYKIQFLNSYDNQLDIIITHIDTNRKYILSQMYDIVEQKYPMFNLYREIVFKPIDGRCKWINLTSLPTMHIELTKFNRKPKPHELDNTILNELKIDTQNYVSYK